MTVPPFLFHVFSTFRVGGPQVRFAALANHFGSRYRHAILAMDGAYDCFERIASDVDAVRWDIPVRKRHTIPNVLAFRRILRARSPDLLITYNWGAIEWALANRPQIMPHMHIEDGFGPEEAQRQLLRRVMTRRFALRNSIVVLPSRNLYRLALNCWHLPKDRVCHIPNGIDCARFAAPSDRLAVPSGSGPVIGTVAALRPEKNIGRLLRAFRLVLEKTPCRLVVAGEGRERAALERLAGETLPPESVLFIGHIHEVEQVYSSLDVFALSSDTEQMPTALMEAMAAGLPAVSTGVGDVSEMVAAANRPFIVPPNDGLFAEALHRLVTDPGMRRTVGAANREAANSHFEIARMFSDYDRLFSSTANTRSQ